MPPRPSPFPAPPPMSQPAAPPVAYALRPERTDDAPAIEALLDRAFGADRHGKRSYAYRQGVAPVESLSLVADRPDGTLIGTIRFWPVLVGDAAHPALLLGPIAVDPALKGCGIGKALIRRGLLEAERHDHGLVVLVGDLPYYAPFGFRPASHLRITMPFERPHRVLAREIREGAAGGGGPLLAAWPHPAVPAWPEADPA